MVVVANTIISYLKLASKNVGLCDKWINGNDLCVAISIIFNLKQNNFTLKELTKELNTKEGKGIKIQMEADPTTVTEDHVGIFRQVYRPKKGPTKKRPSNVYCFYFVSKKGDTPPSYDDEWYNHICEFTQLLQDIKRNCVPNEDITYNVIKKQKASTNTHHLIVATDKKLFYPGNYQTIETRSLCLLQHHIGTRLMQRNYLGQ